jgi:hypothetical protein
MGLLDLSRKSKAMFTEQGSWFAPLTADLTIFSMKILKYADGYYSGDNHCSPS